MQAPTYRHSNAILIYVEVSYSCFIHFQLLVSKGMDDFFCLKVGSQ